LFCRSEDARVLYRNVISLACKELSQNPTLGYPRSFVAYTAARLDQRKTAENEIGQALQSSPGNNKVVINAVLTYEALGQRHKAIGVLRATTPEVLRELDRHPDLADFRQDPRFRQLVSATTRKGE
jgi:hypothetical protein